MADGAHEITNSLVEVFGTDMCICLMCWSHVYCCYQKRLNPLKKSNKDLYNKVDKDLHKIQ